MRCSPALKENKILCAHVRVQAGRVDVGEGRSVDGHGGAGAGVGDAVVPVRCWLWRE